jgi:tetratricopeptide (TPR) repeat protein
MRSTLNPGPWLSAIRVAALALSLLSMAAAAQGDIARTAAQQCRAHARVGVCDDALRWNPSDPSLLVAMGDALMRVRRFPDAIRAYQRAAAIAPHTPGLKDKIETAQTTSAKIKPAGRAAHDASGETESGKRFSNSEPDTQTH